MSSGSGDTSAPTKLAVLVNSASFAESQPVWSPDGTRLAYVSNSDGDKEIYVVTIDLQGEISMSVLRFLRIILMILTFEMLLAISFSSSSQSDGLNYLSVDVNADNSMFVTYVRQRGLLIKDINNQNILYDIEGEYPFWR